MVTLRPLAENCGVMPVETDKLAVTAPATITSPVPDVALPTAQCDTVDEPPVQAGKVMAATFEATPAVQDQPPEVRATATRAYDV